MGDTQLTLQFSIVVAESDKWTKEHLDKVEGFYDSWVSYQISKVMREAGDKFIKENPDLFAVQEVM